MKKKMSINLSISISKTTNETYKILLLLDE